MPYAEQTELTAGRLRFRISASCLEQLPAPPPMGPAMHVMGGTWLGHGGASRDYPSASSVIGGLMTGPNGATMVQLWAPATSLQR